MVTKNRSTNASGSATIFQIKVTIKGTKPPVWRRLLVPVHASLAELHEVLQTAFGWTNSHMHQFIVQGRYYGDPEWDEYGEMHDERRIALRDVAAETSRLVYEYDFGDSWQHEILVEKELPPADGVEQPICIAGRRACPPEDCGGVGGYARLLEILADPSHEEHAEMRAWAGDFKPEAFDLVRVNIELASVNVGMMRPRRRAGRPTRAS